MPGPVRPLHTGAVHPADLWDFDDPAGSERRFRQAAAGAAGADRAVLLTQAARALGLQGRYDEAHALLDEVVAADGGAAEVAVRVLLERGRLHRSAGDPAAAHPPLEEAAAAAERAGLEELHVDALHMVALVAADPAQRRRLTEEALAAARRATDPRARDWDASLLTNLGMTWAEAGDFAAALPLFEEALAARRRIGDTARGRVARWMVAWALRNLGRDTEALALQRALKAELDALGERDPHVEEELTLLDGGPGQTRV